MQTKKLVACLAQPRAHCSIRFPLEESWVGPLFVVLESWVSTMCSGFTSGLPGVASGAFLLDPLIRASTHKAREGVGAQL